MGKYSALSAYLQGQSAVRITCTFEELAARLDGGLPSSAHEFAAWWGNESNGNHAQARGWMSVGWRVVAVDLAGRRVTFERAG